MYNNYYSLNTISLQGRLTRDPEVKINTNGTEYCFFSIAINRYQGKGKEATVEYFNVKTFKRTASRMSQYQKGSMLVIQGFLEENRYMIDDKEARTYAIVAEHVFGLRSTGKTYASKPDVELMESAPNQTAFCMEFESLEEGY